MHPPACASSIPGRWPTFASTAALTVVVVLSLVGRHAAIGGTPRLGWEIAAATLGCALVPLVLRRPLGATLATLALTVVSPAVTPPATFAVAWVARQQRLRTALLVGGVGVMTQIGQWLLNPRPALTLGWWALLAVVTHAALICGGAWAQARTALLQSLRERADRAEAEQQARVLEARLAERTAIAREMHDVLAHRLSLVATYAGALEFRPDTPSDQVAAAAGILRQGVQDALNEVREVIGVLRSDDDRTAPDLRPQPRAVDIEQLIAEARRHGMVVDVDGSPTVLAELSERAGRAAYRLVQEGLTNARRHAPGAPVQVRIQRRSTGEAAITVRNPVPRQPAVTLGSGSGLLGMTERVRLAGGQLEHGIRHDHFQVSASLPCPVSRRDAP